MAVHFYFHPAATDTKYTGTIELAFAQGAVPLTQNVSVKAHDGPGNKSVAGRVSSRPGRYVMTIALNAEGDDRREIREQVLVRVE